MNRRSGVFLIFFFFYLFGFSQSDLKLKLEVSPWQIAHDFKDLSKPYSISYTAGLNFEQVIPQTIFAFSAGVDYAYAPTGVRYMDLTDKQNSLAVIFEKEINERFIEISHHELTLPVMCIFYLNDLRAGIGASYSRYMFGDFNFSDFDKHSIDYGLRAMIGARLSKHLTFSMGYYYGLKTIAELTVQEIDGIDGPNLKGNMQKISFSLGFSIFNSIKNDLYYLSPITSQ